MQIKVMQVGQLGTNCYLLEDEETRTAAVVDPGGEGARILAQLKADGMELKLILLTHAHFDHTGGVAELCAALPGVPVYLHPADAALVGGDVFPAVGAETTPYQDGDVVKLGKMDIEVLHTPGHTPGGVTLKVGDVLLTGDTLFQGSMGLRGRLLRGDHGLPGAAGPPLRRLPRASRPHGGLHPGAGAQDQLLPAGGHGGIRRKAAAPRRKDTAHEAVFTRTRLQIRRRADAAGSPRERCSCGGPV